METTKNNNNNNKNNYYLVCIIPNCSCCPPNAKNYLFYFYYTDEDKFSVFKSDAKRFNSLKEAKKGAYESIEILNKKININITKDDLQIEFYKNNKLKKIIQL